MAFVDYTSPVLSSQDFRATWGASLAKGAFAAMAGLVLLSAVPLGSNREWAYLPMIFLLSLSSIVWGIGYALDGGQSLPLPRFRKIIPAIILFSLFMLWGWLQTQSWLPESMFHPLWKTASHALITADGEPRMHPAIALNPDLTTLSLLRFASYGGVFLITAIMACRSALAERLLQGLALAAGLYALYGLSVYFTGNGKVAWLDKTAYLQNLTSTFINRNSYATFAGMGLLCVLMLTIRTLKPAWRHGYEWSRIWRSFLRLLFLPQTLAMIGGMFTILCALLLTSSRAGIIFSLVAFLACLFMGMARKLPAWVRLLLVALVMLLVAAMLLKTDSATLMRYASTDFEKENRLPVYALVWQAIQDNLWLGHGLANFRDAFPLYRDSSVHGFYDRAHSDWLEMLFDVGIVASAALYGALLWIVYGCWKVWREHRRGKATAVLALSVVLLAALHSTVDFSLQMPANAWWFAMILGLGYAPYWKAKRSEQA
jgi:O-antigen ligase